MLIIRSSFLLAILTQIAVLAAPIPLNGVSLNARANDNALFSRAQGDMHFDQNQAEKPEKPAYSSFGRPGMFASSWIISRHSDPTLDII